MESWTCPQASYYEWNILQITLKPRTYGTFKYHSWINEKYSTSSKLAWITIVKVINWGWRGRKIRRNFTSIYNSIITIRRGKIRTGYLKLNKAIQLRYLLLIFSYSRCFPIISVINWIPIRLWVCIISVMDEWLSDYNSW